MNFASWFQDFPPDIATLLIAMIPVGELRGAIPVAIGAFNLSPLAAYCWAVIGNMIPVVLLLWLLEPVSRWLMAHSKLFNRFFNWLFERTRKKHTKKFEKWGALALITFVAIPLPITGGWTGTVAAFVFGIPFKRALGLIFVGVLLAGVIVTALTVGVTNLF